MGLTNFPNGITGFGVPIIPALDETITGNVFWVSSVVGSNDNPGNEPSVPFASIDYAIGKCVANNGDVIKAMEGHVETISAASSLACDIAGVTVHFLGKGSKRATLNFTATDGTVVISAANVRFFYPRLLAGIDAVVAGINVQAADFQMYSAEDYDAAAKAATIMVLTTSAAARMIIDGYKYFASTTGTQKTNRIKTVGALDGIQLKNIEVSGDFSGSPVNLGDAACTNVKLENISVNNTNVGPLPALTLHANTTGFAKNVKARVVSGTTYISSVAKVQWSDDSEGFSTDGYGGEPLGTVLATGLEGKIDIIDGYFDAPTADAATDTTIRDAIGRKTDAAVYVPGTTKALAAYVKGTADLQERVAKKAAATMVDAQTMFTIAGGPIEIMALVSVCETLNDATASTLQYNVIPTTGTATTISGASASLANAAAGASVALAGTALTTAALLSAGGPNLMANPGTIFCPIGTINMVVGVGSTTGTWAHYLRYKPLAVGVTVS